MAGQLQAVRRDLHTYAQPGWCEIRTASLGAKRLAEVGYQVLIGSEVCLAEARMGLPSAEELEAAYQRALRQGAVQPYAQQVRDGFTGVIGILDCGAGPTVAALIWTPWVSLRRRTAPTVPAARVFAR